MNAAAIDRASPLPLWAQVLADLRVRLEANEFAHRFPTDDELVRSYGVSRQTAREAVRRLADEGLVERERGRGTRVRPRAFEHVAGTLESLFEHVESRGLVQDSHTLAHEERTDERVAALLEVAAQESLVYLERLRYADEEPLALDRSWLPARLARPLLNVDLTRTGIYVELAARCGVTLRSGSERVRPAIPSPADRRLLRLPRGEAAFSVQRLTRGEREPVEWRESLIRGDRWSLLVELAPVGGSLPWAPVGGQP
ncbi:MAG TPA: GntR family transcriptional regulator [Solirubrobacteraceae bacterium]|jgi:GntR family transcriptional regulator|nr:GntR family transcriptional regulator [Solirubrobacteraceae bacterium]